MTLPLLPERPAGDSIREAILADETDLVTRLLDAAALSEEASTRVSARLSTQEGVLLMCVAEALLRIPDAATADRLIRDKLSRGDWHKHLGQSTSLMVNASTWGLMLTGKLTQIDSDTARDPAAWYERVVARAGEPVVRLALRQAMRIMAEQFVMGRTIGEALERSRSGGNARFRHSFDMLGESAITAADAKRYHVAYAQAIAAIAAAREPGADLFAQSSISVKLSALHPRYEFAQQGRALAELVPAIAELARIAASGGIGLTIDAEESERLELSLEIFARVRRDASLTDWEGLGLAVQAYQKRAPAVIDWLAALCAEERMRMPVRLVKGAYWDTEVKRAQVQGLPGYPVFTRKAHTDVTYLACARRIVAAHVWLYPMFATHNAHTASAIIEFAAEHSLAHRDFEFQRLHGMGETLYDEIAPADNSGIACRVYAPVGSHQDLLPYLVRRLLENGANTSFVNRIADVDVAVEDVIADPVRRVRERGATPSPAIPLPRDLFLPERINSRGASLADQMEMATLDAAFESFPHPCPSPSESGVGSASEEARWSAAPIIGGQRMAGPSRTAMDPSDHRRAIGGVVDADATHVDRAISRAVEAQRAWDAAGGEERAALLERAASFIEDARDELVVLLAREAGKTRGDAIGEVREAADFCRYYAAGARRHFAQALSLPSPTGESNQLALRGRGAFICISPWNFPLAIFTGQIAAALAAGNAAIAKPAEQTPLIAIRAAELMLAAGIPVDILAVLPGSGEVVGAALVADARSAGVAFTGSTDVARGIAGTLARRDVLVPLIAETGGQNALIVDSSNSAGQRCSALRVLFLQDEIAPRVMELLQGAMDELVIGDPALLATDVGPVIDRDARDSLEAHVASMTAEGRVRHRVALPDACSHGTFVAPTLVELDRIDRLEREVFGPVLHVIRYSAAAIEEVVDSINATGYGLTLGIHSRIDETVRRIVARARVGNVYVNRNMIGAVVGVQPFGGEGLSGTGPKAGGPNYLFRFAVERTLSINTAAAGGNAALLSQGEA
ncbi:MAG: bifunctional proline dehydrogenase/L-glutamate gamma-semialdehyde dehydrogenase PutA [Betaproteobacteria bacterium]|nr:MAG: bifunctional proline dehydrogenase/L-glutamate gamma-semialdehyde dehydrogenase PutA [Betaproteobacteria bacterium]